MGLLCPADLGLVADLEKEGLNTEANTAGVLICAHVGL